MSATGRTSTDAPQLGLLDVGARAPGRHPDDYYATPAWCVDAILPVLPLAGGIIEPSCGDGAILDPEVFIDGDARLNAPLAPRTSARDPKTGAWHRQLSAALVHTVPLDPRRSLYVRFGDWFAMLCCASVVFVALSVLLPKRDRSPA